MQNSQNNQNQNTQKNQQNDTQARNVNPSQWHKQPQQSSKPGGNSAA